jgi:ankyrin repeat protein
MSTMQWRIYPPRGISMNKIITFLYLSIVLIGSTSLAMFLDDGAINLHRAAYAGNIQKVQALLDANIPADSKDDIDVTPLMQAAWKGHAKVCKLLLKYNAQVHEKTIDGWTPLIFAAYEGQKNICQLLIRANAEVGIKDNTNATSLMWAAHKSHKNICHLLIDIMLKPIKQNIDSTTAFLGCNRKRRGNLPHQLPYDVAKIIARQIHEPAAQKQQSLFAQINAIENEIMRDDLYNYAQQQLKSHPKTKKKKSYRSNPKRSKKNDDTY